MASYVRQIAPCPAVSAEPVRDGGPAHQAVELAEPKSLVALCQLDTGSVLSTAISISFPETQIDPRPTRGGKTLREKRPSLSNSDLERPMDLLQHPPPKKKQDPITHPANVYNQMHIIYKQSSGSTTHSCTYIF